MDMSNKYRMVNQPVRKKDAMALLTGQPLYTDDLAPADCLVVKLLRSPYAYARIRNIDVEAARRVEGIEAVYTYRDVPKDRFTIAGQSYPEWSPYDRLILEDRVRFVGDAVAIVAGETEAAVDRCLKRIKVDYEVLEPVLDFHQAKDNPIVIHPEEDWSEGYPCGGDHRRNLCAHEVRKDGDVDAAFAECEEILEETYHTKANQQVMMETFQAFTQLDAYGRLHITSSTQIVFHVRRIVARALGIPGSQVRVTKPRIGGGFGAKQTVVAEIYPAFVTWKTKKPAKLIYTREECQIAGSPRHEMEVTVKLGAMRDGRIKAVEITTLSNGGAYGEHSPCTVALTGEETITLYNSNLKAHRFTYDVVYTNTQPAGAYRGFGATQGTFAMESAVNQLADRLHMDPVKLRRINMVKTGQVMPSYFGETLTSCSLDRCLARAEELFGWEEKSRQPIRDMGNGRIRSIGVAMAMQSSGISHVDVGSATISLEEGGHYSLSIGAADMGTGCDTILAQMAAECLDCDVEQIAVFGADSDISPYDSGSYASSTTYVTGTAVKKACDELKERMCTLGARMLKCELSEVEFLGDCVGKKDRSAQVTLKELGFGAVSGNSDSLKVTASHCSEISPPPFMVGMAEIELDTETGSVEIIDYVAVVDCGTVINTNLARVQTEGGLAQGIGMALYENVQYSDRGRILENSLMQYRIPSRLDSQNLRVEFESSYEPSHPFGAKSIGEIVINTPAPALAHAVFNATGVWHRELPMTPEKILLAMEN